MSDSYVNWELIKQTRAMQNAPDQQMCCCTHPRGTHVLDPEGEALRCIYSRQEFNPYSGRNQEVVCICTRFRPEP